MQDRPDHTSSDQASPDQASPDQASPDQASPDQASAEVGPTVESLSAITLSTIDMASSVRFYLTLGFELLYGGPDAGFTSFRAGSGYLNLAASTSAEVGWGRVIFYVADVDAVHRRALAGGYVSTTEPADAPWNERYFHIADPTGHEISLARPLKP